MNIAQLGIRIANNLRRNLGLTITEVGGCNEKKQIKK